MIIFVGLLYYLDKKGYIVITEKVKNQLDKKWEDTKQQGKGVVKDGVKSAFKKGGQIVDEALEEYKQEKKD